MFHIASAEDITGGKVTDAYFVRTLEVLRCKAVDPEVVCEIRASRLAEGWRWAIFAGLEEALNLLVSLGKPVNVYALPEGSVFYAREPVLWIAGKYLDLCVYETALLGLLCQASGIATRAARCKLAAQGRPVYSFGARRMHPVIAPLVDRNAYIGGCDGVSVVRSGELIGQPAVGTIPHALILILGDTVRAISAFHEHIQEGIPRIALIDTFGDEKFEALRVAEALGENLHAIRLDTPSSRRGDFTELLEEVRWELDLRGYQQVKIFISGGLRETTIRLLNPFADGYGVGTAISNSPVIDFSLDIVEIEGKPVAKRGKRAGRKMLIASPSGERRIVPAGGPVPEGWEPLLVQFIRDGKMVRDLPCVGEIREGVLRSLERLSLD